ncbi:tRNA lysidine(34) synthetase TilS [Paracoccus sp. DMF-8]|uniref:tRNA lysidine(34) synthetase TilS n=1 Tax=Paracoccus sp. DMF-8 TaxID=3019445 RepID=UPI0023E833C1|nr:tRNA lysidine(34) synthetase TilS [Paracoccus sp. DMF-8]MDF3607111.1 tRNA lysidine(34) synthetase TilS [Paracoccus sp. DMF-8]
MTADLAGRISTELNRLAGDMSAVGVAVSGGGDSAALLHLVTAWAAGRRVMAATVDHGLRRGSADEARFAARMAQDLGVAHETLHWRREDGPGNLMAQAREARLRLLSDWAARNRLDAVMLGHTLDDQAETLLMRLGRGAGVDGLSGMAASRLAFGTVWLRPMLGLSRQELRDWLRGQGLRWIDDPSNQNLDYERVRMRKALEALDIPAASLGQTAANLAMARAALQEFAARATENIATDQARISLQLSDFTGAPEEIRRRILVTGLRWMTGSDYPARRDEVLHAMVAVGAGGRTTLEGVILERRASRLRMIREPAAAARRRRHRRCRWRRDLGQPLAPRRAATGAGGARSGP